MRKERVVELVNASIVRNDLSLSKIAHASSIPKTTLYNFLKGKRDLPEAAVSRLLAAVDPLQRETDIVAARMFVQLRRRFFTRNQIRRIGRDLCERASLGGQEERNDLERIGTP